MVQFSILSSAMESRDHSKNVASPKSQMSRGNNFIKMSKTTVVMFALFAFGILYSQNSVAQMGSSGILGKLQKIIDYAEDRDMEVVRVETDIIRTTNETIRTLDPSFTYTIAAVGSNRIKDIDIEVYKKVNSGWILVKKDDDVENIAVVNISPSSYAEYKIIVKVYKFNSGYDVGHYGLVIYHD